MTVVGEASVGEEPLDADHARARSPRLASSWLIVSWVAGSKTTSRLSPTATVWRMAVDCALPPYPGPWGSARAARSPASRSSMAPTTYPQLSITPVGFTPAMVAGGLLRACARQGLVQLLGSQGELAPAASGGGALITDWAGPAGRGVELDHDHLRAALAGRAPRGAALPFRTTDLAGLPIDGERGLVEPVTGSGLAGGVQQRRGHQGQPELAMRLLDHFGAGVAGVDVVFGGQQMSPGQLPVDRGGHLHIRHGRGGGRHVGDQVRSPRVGLIRLGTHGGLGLVPVVPVIVPVPRRSRVGGVVGGVAGLGEVELVAAPEQVLALGGPAGVGVIGRAEPVMGRREPVFLRLPSADHLPPRALMWR